MLWDAHRTIKHFLCFPFVIYAFGNASLHSHKHIRATNDKKDVTHCVRCIWNTSILQRSIIIITQFLLCVRFFLSCLQCLLLCFVPNGFASVQFPSHLFLAPLRSVFYIRLRYALCNVPNGEDDGFKAPCICAFTVQFAYSVWFSFCSAAENKNNAMNICVLCGILHLHCCDCFAVIIVRRWVPSPSPSPSPSPMLWSSLSFSQKQ